MPVQQTLFGRPVRLQMPPRRFQALFVFLVFIVVTLACYGPPPAAALPTYEEVAEAVKNPHLPNLSSLPAVPNPFGPSAHKPPTQPNSTASSSYRAIEWLSDFKWRNPFSSTVALDENRAVLPPLQERPPIYTYYDAQAKQARHVTEAENRLILAWRRAWWAQGFKPQVLSRAEAMQNPHYQLVQRMKLDTKTELEMMRWLAWERMGGGVLVNWLALPMAEYGNPMLTFLRRSEFPKLSRVETLNSAVFFGDRAAVSDAIKTVVNSGLLRDATANQVKIAELAKKEGGAVVNLLPPAHVTVDKKADGIAYYSTETIASKYMAVAEKLADTTQAEGLDLLASLVNSHLHLVFQQQYPEGVVVVKPLPEHTTALMYEATDIARNLTQCPATPVPKSCPPNLPKCAPCDVNKPVKLQASSEFVNTTKFFTIGTVPHPYTINSLHYTRDTLDANFLRNNAERDLWIFALTQKSSGEKHSGSYRLLQFKDLVAATPSHTLWLTAERVTQADLDWIFGFELPQIASAGNNPDALNHTSKITVFPRPGPPEPLKDVQVPDDQWIKKEEDRLKKARDAIKSKDRFMQNTVLEVEQWNLADTEAWKFARAFSARRRMERKKWEEEERNFAGSEKNAGVRGGARYSDRR